VLVQGLLQAALLYVASRGIKPSGFGCSINGQPKGNLSDAFYFDSRQIQPHMNVSVAGDRRSRRAKKTMAASHVESGGHIRPNVSAYSNYFSHYRAARNAVMGV